jgi:hypothetical protein
MLWMMRMVLLAMGSQTCGLHSDGLQLRPGKPQPSAGLGVAFGLACDGRFPSVPDAHEPGLGQGVKHVPDGARFQSLEPRVGRVGLEPTTGGL